MHSRPAFGTTPSTFLPGMSFRRYPPATVARFEQLTELYPACRTALFRLAQDTNWEPAVGSAASQDQAALADRKPALPSDAFDKIGRLLYFYTRAASEYLAALGALYLTHEVLFAPVPLVRSALEHCAAATWMLRAGGSVDDRLARAYLEELASAVEANKTSGHLTGKGHAEHLRRAEHLTALREEVERVFGESPTHEGAHRIRGQRRPGPLTMVEFTFRAIGQPVPREIAWGISDYLANRSHATLYPHEDMWTTGGSDENEFVELGFTVEDHEKLARFAVIPYYELLTHITVYNGWPPDAQKELTAAMERLLGPFSASARVATNAATVGDSS